MPTLYISDLDGTLLNSRSEISEKTACILNELIDRGVLFSIATARNIGTVFDKISKLHLSCPLCAMNGVFLYEQNNPVPLQVISISSKTAQELSNRAVQAGASPFFYQYHTDTHLLDLKYRDLDFPARSLFYELRKNCRYKRFVHTPGDFIADDGCLPVYINFLDKYPVLEKVKLIVDAFPELQSVFYHDPVLNAWYLEVFSADAGKAAGAKNIASLVGADRLVSFGDNNNDVPMFRISDLSFATANASRDIQKQASGVIDSCDRDGVAQYLLDCYKNSFSILSR